MDVYGIEMSIRAQIGPRRGGPVRMLLLAALLLSPAAGAQGAAEGAGGRMAPAPLPLSDVFFVGELVDAVGGGELAEGLRPCFESLASLTVQGHAPEAVIATLPDPVASRFGRELDLFLAAFRRAMEQLDYVQDRHCLPWADQLMSPEADAREEARELPGLILYRDKAEVSRRVLALLVVGETPAWGVSRPALRRALRVLHQIEDRRGEDRLEVRILGPTFSSSTESLAAGLADWVDAELLAAVDLAVVSGTATVPANRTEIERALGCAGAGGPGMDCGSDEGRLRLAYVSAATGNDAFERHLLGDWLRDSLGGVPHRAVALLQESSLYGSSFAAESGEGRFHVLPFPMHISRLRGEYGEGGPCGTRTVPTAEIPGGPRTLALELGEQRSAGDAVPLFDPKGSLRSHDMVLANILRTIANNRIQVVVIVATNVLDTLFLAEKVYQYAPDVRLMTYEGDLLLSHPGCARSSRGMVVASSFPLLVPDPFERSEAAGGQSFQFASDNAQGVFEAGLCLVGSDCEGAFDHEVWISAVGNGGLIPLKRYEVETDAAGEVIQERLSAILDLEPAREAEAAAEEGRTVAALGLSPPRGWSLIFSVATVVLMAALGYGFVGLRRGGPLAAGLIELDLPGSFKPGYRPRSTRRVRGAFLVLIPLVAAFPYCLLSGPYLHQRGENLLWLAAVVGLAGLLVATALALLGLAWRTFLDFLLEPAGLVRRERRRRAALLFLPLGSSALLALASSLCIVWIFYQYLFGLERDDVVLLLNRSISFGSGLSPLLPALMVFTVWFLWVLSSLWRQRTLAVLPDREDLETPETRVPLPSDTVHRDLVRIRESASPLGGLALQRFVVPASLLLVAPFFYLLMYYHGPPTPILRSVEPQYFDAALSLAFATALVLAVGSGVCMVRGWLGFSSVLDCLVTYRFRVTEGDEGCRPSWLQAVEKACEPSSYSRSVIESRRERSFRDLMGLDRGAFEGGLGEKLLALRDRGVARQSFSRVWLEIVDWLSWQAARRAAAPAQAAAEAAEKPAMPIVVDRARTFFAWQTTLVANELSFQLRLLMGFMTVALLLLLLTVLVYPFEPQRVLVFYLESLVVLGVAASLYVIFKSEKNQILSLLTGTDPEKVSWRRALFGRLGLFAAVPVLSLLASGFPELRQALVEWIEPLFKIFL